MGIASIILGIVSLLLGVISLGSYGMIATLLALAGIVLGSLESKNGKSPVAIIGIVISTISLLVCISAWIACAAIKSVLNLFLGLFGTHI